MFAVPPRLRRLARLVAGTGLLAGVWVAMAAPVHASPVYQGF